MGEVFILLFFLSFVILIVGLIKPRWILRWGEIQTRKRVLLIFGSVAIVCFALSNAFLSSVTLEEKTAKSERQAIEEKAKEEKNREQAKTKLTEMGIAFTEKNFIKVFRIIEHYMFVKFYTDKGSRTDNTEFFKLANKEYRENYINDIVKSVSEITESIINKIK